MTVKSIDEMDLIEYLKGKTSALLCDVREASITIEGYNNGLPTLINEILEVLESLGLRINELGTHFYADIIKKAYMKLENEGKDDEDIRSELKNPYSGLYFDVARNDKDIGLKTFHSIIDEAFINLDEDTINYEIRDNIFCGTQINDRGDLALIVAKYIRGQREKKEKPKFKKRISK